MATESPPGVRRRAPLLSPALIVSLLPALLLPLTAHPQEAGGGEGKEPAAQERDAQAPGSGENARTLSLSVDDAIRIALENNLDLKIEAITHDRAQRDIAIAKAAFDPVFQTSFTMSKFRSPSVSFLDLGTTVTSAVTVNPFNSQAYNLGISGLLSPGTQYSITAEDSRSDTPRSGGIFGINPRHQTSIVARFTQPLLRGFGARSNLADLRIARRSWEIAGHRRRRLIETTVGSVMSAYWNLVFARRDLEVKEEALTEAETLLEINRHRVAVGTAREIDVIDAEANIETQKSGIIDARNALRRAQDTLLDLLNYRRVEEPPAGSPLYEGIQIVPATELAFEPFPVELGAAIRLALDERDDLREASLAIESSQLDLERRRNDRLPALNLQGSWTQAGLEGGFGDSLDELGSGRFYDWSLGVSFEMPLGNRQARGRLAQARADLQSARLAREKLENGIILEVTQVVRDIESARQRVLTTRAASRLRSEQLEAETQRLRVGTSTSYQVLQIHNDLLEAQGEELRALVDHRNAVTAFYSAVGTILPSVGISLE
ncbi:MAG: TolC family protein [Planctomycetota bacterium]